MMYLGDYAASATVHVPWASNGADGASITRATDGSIRIYKDASTTQRTSSAGITDSEDFDSLTGLHWVTIDLSDNTDAGFYAAAHNYTVVLQGAVIDGKTINTVLGHFSIQNRYSSSSLDAAGVRSAVGLASANLDTQLDALPTAIENADALLSRDVSAITESAMPKKSLYATIAKTINKVTILAGVLSIYRTDDATVHATQTLTTDAAADPVVSQTKAT